ncbi:MAG: DUF512 domain-containing protein [candidate division Zixibacteria bacterium]|nr:DUF512 domain-containing protein [candidate division Zixibacteria bacterium]
MAQSFDDLLGLYPDVPSVGVVPIGLTQHRDDLPNLQLVDERMAIDILNQVGKRQKSMRKRHGLGAIYAADEMFLIAKRAIPPEAYYDDYCQLENGIGMLRQLKGRFDSREGDLPRRLARPIRLCCVTGASAGPFIAELCERVTRKVKNLEVQPLVVDNDFWGRSVTVSGLLTAGDIGDSFMRAGLDVDAAVLPPECLNTDGLFLDDETVPGLRDTIELPVLESEYDFVQTILNATTAVRSAQPVGVAQQSLLKNLII